MASMEAMRARLDETEMDSSSHVQYTVSKAEDTLTDVAEDVDASQPEANTRLTEADAIAACMGITRTREESAKHAQIVTKKRPAFQI